MSKKQTALMMAIEKIGNESKQVPLSDNHIVAISMVAAYEKCISILTELLPTERDIFIEFGKRCYMSGNYDTVNKTLDSENAASDYFEQNYENKTK